MKRNRIPSLLVLLAAMALLPTRSAEALKTGDMAPDFQAKDSTNKEIKLSEFRGKYVVLEWVNPDCPFIRKHYSSGNMQALQKKFTERGVAWLSVSSSAPGKQGFLMANTAEKFRKDEKTASTALLLDSKGTVGRLYDAKATPHMFVIDPKGALIYQGAIDDTPSTNPDDIAKSKNYVAAALEESMAGKSVSTASTAPYGCSVKY